MTLIFLSLFFPSFAGSSNGISPLLFNAGLVSHYRRYLNPVDPRMFVANGNVQELNKSNCTGKRSGNCLKYFTNVVDK